MKDLYLFMICLLLGAGIARAQNGYITIETSFTGKMNHLCLKGHGTAAIDWGDGTPAQTVELNGLTDTIDDGLCTGSLFISHTYARPGKKTITVTGAVTCMNTGATKSVTAVDVGNMPGLTRLYVSGELLTALDVSRNAALVELSCGNNRLTALDVGNNPELEFLYCSINNLSKLDVSRNPKLRWIPCKANKLSARALVDIFTSLPVRTTESPCYIHCYDNQGYRELTEADKAIVFAKGWEIIE